MGVGFWEIVLILIIALIVINPKKLPETTYVLGSVLNNINKKIKDFKQVLYNND